MTNREIIAKLNAILKRENPCGIHKKGTTVHCNDYLDKPCVCCDGCPHLTANGCSVYAPSCKFYFCNTAWGLLTPGAREQITILGKDYKGDLFFRNGTKLLDKPPYIYL